ncbi:Purine ribonucleoside efflux pump NepI [Pseudomonas fluorescens]|uniref:Purine ribonucleoside efflux pump NepI n=1 Tax=Pseudomonas fluorescens TaxID=294 RepID=A0A5E6XJG1_PSEFL|nr:MFS transporter [Pseudomonas fluorescens]VVN40777.1 Purine ribonucleoside efflux pump NepI [Pseudomonas fluorescens]
MNDMQAIPASVALDQTQPSSWRDWLSVFSVALGAFAFVTTEYLPVGILPQIANSLAITDGTAGLMVTVPGIVAAVSAPAIMLGAGRLNRRHLLLLLTLVQVVANLVSAFAPSLVVMLLGRGLLGVALGGFWAVAIAVAARLVSESRAAKATALIFAGITMATVFGVPFGTFVSTLFSWRVSFAVAAALALLALIAQGLTLPSLPSREGLRVGALLGFLARKTARRSMLLLGLVVAAHFSAYTYIAPFLGREAGFSASAITSILLGFGLVGMLANFAMARGSARHLRASLGAVVLLMVIAQLALPQLQAVGVVLAVLLWGIAYGAIPLGVSTWMQLTSPQLPEASAAMLVTMFQVAIATGSLLGGLMVDHHGVPSALWLGAAIGLLGLAVMLSFGVGKAPIAEALQR